MARADLFPHITITGFLGFIAGRGNLFGETDSHAWAVTPALSWSAFDIGSARARLRGAKAGTREAEAFYEQIFLRVLEETENAFVNWELVRISRLSVMPVSATVWRKIEAMGEKAHG